MFPSTHTDFLLVLHEERTSRLRAEADRFRLARALSHTGTHRRTHWWSRSDNHPVAATRAPAHP